MKTKWYGEPPKKCDICNNDIKGVFIDGRTKQGVWGIMCKPCHKEHGVGLGTGRGQKYKLQVIQDGEKEWIKVKKAF